MPSSVRYVCVYGSKLLHVSTPIRSGLTDNDCDSGKSRAATKLLPEVEGGGVERKKKKLLKPVPLSPSLLSHPPLATSRPFLQGCGYCIIAQAKTQSNIRQSVCVYACGEFTHAYSGVCIYE